MTQSLEIKVYREGYTKWPMLCSVNVSGAHFFTYCPVPVVLNHCLHMIQLACKLYLMLSCTTDCHVREPESVTPLGYHIWLLDLILLVGIILLRELIPCCILNLYT